MSDMCFEDFDYDREDDLHSQAAELEEEKLTSTNTTKDKIIQILGNMSAEDRDEIFGNWCRLCGAELPCYCAPCYDE